MSIARFSRWVILAVYPLLLLNLYSAQPSTEAIDRRLNIPKLSKDQLAKMDQETQSFRFKALPPPQGEFLAGATSRSVAHAAQICGNGGIYTRPDLYIDWINDVADEFQVARPTAR
jgi:hypothetical protein